MATASTEERETREERVIARARARQRALAEIRKARELRRRAGLAQAHVAEALGVSRITVTRWETGANTPRGDMLIRYVRLLRRAAAGTD